MTASPSQLGAKIMTRFTGLAIVPEIAAGWPLCYGGSRLHDIRGDHRGARAHRDLVAHEAGAHGRGRSAPVGRDAGLQRTAHDRRNHPACARGPGAHAADRGRRLLDRRHPRDARRAAARARLRAPAAAAQSGQGRGAAPGLCRRHRRPRDHSGRRPRVFARGVPAADRADLPGPRGRRLRLAVHRAATASFSSRTISATGCSRSSPTSSTTRCSPTWRPATR